jgi:hypothetical protein
VNTGKWYLRIYLPVQSSQKKHIYVMKPAEFILPAAEVFEKIIGCPKMDCVDLDTGGVARHDYKKPLPKWLEEPVARAMAAATNKAP